MASPKFTRVFTKPFLDSLTGSGERGRYSDTSTKGLVLVVSADGNSKTFYFNYRTRAGVQRRFKLGNYPQVKLSQARQQAIVKAGAVAAGYDPQGELAEARAERITYNAGDTLGGYLHGLYWPKLQTQAAPNKSVR